MSESPNLVSLFLDDEVKPRKLLSLPINSLIARQWPNQDKNQASWLPAQDSFYYMQREIILQYF